MWLLRLVSSAVFLFLIVFTIPLSFDVGGRDCGLAFSLALATYYFFFSILQLLTPNESRIRFAFIQSIKYTQWITITILMFWSLNKFSIDSKDNASGSWAQRTFSFTNDESFQAWLFGRRGFLESLAINGWDKVLRYSTPVFQLLEGFCSLLIIQACGQITRWLVNRERGDTWMIGLLGVSASIISVASYFLWRITTFPELNNVDAILIGATLTCVIILGSWGIGSGRGNPVESSLLFAYITLCIYQIFTDYKPSHPSAAQATLPVQSEYPPLPPMIMATYTTLLNYFSTLPTAVHASWHFFLAAIFTITPSVIISLIYRVFVMYAAARIIPAVRESGARALSQDPTLEDDDDAGRFLGFLSWFSPSILIAVYTSLLMQHFSTTNGHGSGISGEWWSGVGGDAGGNAWRWINVAATMTFYAVELYIGRDDDVVTTHWHVE
ncbi:hypothetical protein Vi05172_g4619 [Venturia inaequalis]|uniref:ER membrane protein n=1 Tax=Venturia inaequalis TaxID=5025 RepID=A0A8H3ZEG8_VENIN|nr:hypothetical protein EG327_002919 [Venturia inaequalis]RDI85349.1 hypothetical protein Vi05172_g4619 [Venturia inaequalis]